MKTCQPPVAETRTPRLQMPANAVDAHCHVFGPTASFPFHPKRKYTPPDAPLEALQKLHKTLGLERAVIVQATCHGTDNAAMLAALAHAPNDYRGVAMVENAVTPDEIEQLHSAGVRGVRFSFARHIGGVPDFALVKRVSHIIAPLGWHVEVYLEAADLADNLNELRRMPCPIVIDHYARVKTVDGVGQRAFRILLDLLRGEDLWVKISCAERISSAGPPYGDVIPFAQAIIEARPERVLWGTDWPHPNIPGMMPNDGDLVDLLGDFAPDEGLRRRILVDNPARLYGF